MGATKNLTFNQGKTFSLALRWETGPINYKAITAITQTAPARVTAPSHGIPDGWRVAIVSVKGMTQINAENAPPRPKDHHKATVVDSNTIEFNDINAAEFKAYQSGGYLQFNTPVSMVGMTARMSVKDKAGGTQLLSLTTEDDRIVIDDAAKTITLNLSAADTALITWKRGVYDLELVSADGEVTGLLSGEVTVTQEVTT